MVCNVSIVASKENEKKWYLNPSSNNFQRGDWCPMRLVNVAGHYAESFYFYFFWPFISLQTILKTTKWDCYTKLFLYSIKEQNLFNPNSLSVSLSSQPQFSLYPLSLCYCARIIFVMQRHDWKGVLVLFCKRWKRNRKAANKD